MSIPGIIVFLIGLFSIVCAAADFDWFMDHYKARFMCRMLGRNGARVFYVVIGLAFCVLGVLFFLGILPEKA